MGRDDAGQISELSQMTPNRGSEPGAPGTDDGVPPAEAADTEPGAGPRNYGDDETG